MEHMRLRAHTHCTHTHTRARARLQVKFSGLSTAAMCEWRGPPLTHQTLVQARMQERWRENHEEQERKGHKQPNPKSPAFRVNSSRMHALAHAFESAERHVKRSRPDPFCCLMTGSSVALGEGRAGSRQASSPRQGRIWRSRGRGSCGGRHGRPQGRLPHHPGAPLTGGGRPAGLATPPPPPAAAALPAPPRSWSPLPAPPASRPPPLSIQSSASHPPANEGGMLLCTVSSGDECGDKSPAHEGSVTAEASRCLGARPRRPGASGDEGVMHHRDLGHCGDKEVIRHSDSQALLAIR